MEREMLKEQIETVNCEIKALRENQEGSKHYHNKTYL